MNPDIKTVIFGLVLTLLLAVCLFSFLAIWAVNTLFGLDIAFTVENVLAATILVFIIGDNKVHLTFN